VIAERVGKTVLRPGGSAATEEVHRVAHIEPGNTVLELSAGLGRSGIELAQKYGAMVTLTDIDVSRLDRAEVYAQKLGVSDMVSTKQLDMFKLESGLGSDVRFDVAQTEASLTHYPRLMKAKFFNSVAQYADKFILHDVCFRTNDKDLQKSTMEDMSKVLNIGFVPETSEMWQELLSNAGFSIDYVVTGEIAILNPLSLLKDEGVRGVANIAYNIATQPYLRSRVLSTKRMISKHSKELGYIAIVATKE
jgi:cyclopropane fatty-acyl-phospholipid synthase-like methyltransferase